MGLGRVGVDVLLARELADLEHQLVGDLAKHQTIIGAVGVSPDVDGGPKRMVTSMKGLGSDASAGCTSRVPISPTGTIGLDVRNARRATPV